MGQWRWGHGIWETENENLVTTAVMVECDDNKVSSEEIGMQLTAFYTYIKMQTMVRLIKIC